MTVILWRRWRDSNSRVLLHTYRISSADPSTTWVHLQINFAFIEYPFSPDLSRENKTHGGVQLSALGPDKNCAAYVLADRYMKTYYPEWYQRYPVVLKDFDEYTAFADNAVLGRFSWDVSGNSVLTDPESIRSMTAEQVLAVLFGEAK